MFCKYCEHVFASFNTLFKPVDTRATFASTLLNLVNTFVTVASTLSKRVGTFSRLHHFFHDAREQQHVDGLQNEILYFYEVFIPIHARCSIESGFICKLILSIVKA